MDTNIHISDSMKALADSAEIFDACEEVGKEFGLHIDQIGELDAQIRQVIRGQAKSKEFTKDIQKHLEIDADLANKITAEVNVRVFQTIKNKLREESATPATDAQKEIDILEQAGGFSVEPSLASSSADGKDPMFDVNESEKSDILSGIENPKPSPSTSTPKPTESHIEPLADHLLGNASAQTEQKIAHKTEEPPVNLPISEKAPVPNPIPPTPKPPVQPPRPAPKPRTGPDPYHEPIE